MQLTAHYLSHSLLASILIRDRGERGGRRRAGGDEERETDGEGGRSERYDEGEVKDRDKRRDEGRRQGKERGNLT